MKDQRELEALSVRYLLGQLSEAENENLEEEFFSSDESYEQLLALEDELRYDYAQDKLSRGDRARFEERFLTSAAERKRVEFAEALVSRLSERAVADTVQSKIPRTEEIAPRWQRFSAHLRAPSFRIALATAASAILLLGVVQLFSENRKLQAQAQNSRARAQRLDQELAEERRQRSALEDKLAQASQPTPDSREAPSAQPIVLSLMLSPGRLRAAGEPVARTRVPQNVDLVRLQLKLKRGAEYVGYRATLLKADGGKVWSQESVPITDMRTVVLELPASVLKEEDYLVVLRGVIRSGSTEPAGTYYLSVIRQ